LGLEITAGHADFEIDKTCRASRYLYDADIFPNAQKERELFVSAAKENQDKEVV
jgi:hypothetical protein